MKDSPEVQTLRRVRAAFTRLMNDMERGLLTSDRDNLLAHARRLYAHDGDIEVSADALLSEGRDGTWVQGWLLVPHACEGWAVFNEDTHPTIQRIDEPDDGVPRFANDDEALAYVRMRAREGSERHAEALRVCGVVEGDKERIDAELEQVREQIRAAQARIEHLKARRVDLLAEQRPYRTAWGQIRAKEQEGK